MWADYLLALKPIMSTPQRRRLPREGVDPVASLEHGLASWRLVQAAWRTRLDSARKEHDTEQIAASQVKLEQCEAEIARIEKLLQDLRKPE